MCCFFFFKQKTAYEMRISDWSSDVCSSDLPLDDVSLTERADLLVEATGVIADAGVPLAQASHQIWDTEKWFVSSEGSRIAQRLVECGAVIDATAIGDGETQRRSYPGVRGQRSEEHTSELQSLMRNSYAVF